MVDNFNHSQKVQNWPKAPSSNLVIWGLEATDLFPRKKSGNQNKTFSGIPCLIPIAITYSFMATERHGESEGAPRDALANAPVSDLVRHLRVRIYLTPRDVQSLEGKIKASSLFTEDAIRTRNCFTNLAH